jgi:hypothetical protein
MKESTMRTIYKYSLAAGMQTIDMPQGAEILTVQVQRFEPQLWALVDPAAAVVPMTFAVYGTRHPVSDEPQRYVGTFQVSGGALVFHVFLCGVDHVEICDAR